jgi:hypothetical protein
MWGYFHSFIWHSHSVTQCSIPAFEGLLKEPHNKHLIKLLYQTAEWHSFAKLRMHTQLTLDYLKLLTKEFGHLMWNFCDLTCSEFKTKELPHELEAKICIQSRVQAWVGPSKSSRVATSAQQSKMLNLFTLNFHALGDYVHTIQMFRTMDSFLTQLVWNSCRQYTWIYMLMNA